MEEQEILDEIKSVGKQVAAFKTELGKKADNEAFKKIEDQLKELSENKELKKHSEEANKKLDDITKQVNEMLADLAIVKDNGSRSERKSREELVEEAVQKNADAIRKLASGSGSVKVKIGGPSVNKTQVTRASVGSTTMAMRLAEVGQLPYLGTVMSGLFRHAPVSDSSNGVIRYYDQATATRNAAAVAEGAQKPESAITWVERTLLLEKIADSIPVSKEAWRDVYFIQSEIDRLLNVNLALNEDAQLWDGDGNTPNLKGVYTSASAFSYGGPAITDANLYDLIACTRVSISNNKQSKYSANVAILNPLDVLSMKLAKDTEGRYLLPPFVTNGGSSVDSCLVVESSQVTANTMLVGDFRYGTIYDLEGVEITMGHIDDQFVKNAMTILAEKREGLLIRNVDADAFMKITDVTAALAQIEAGS